MRKSKAEKRDSRRLMRRENKVPETWTRCKDNICRICKEEINETITVYLGEPYHGNCMYPGPM